ncbi:outer membrane protein [Sinorhizobium sp. BG8]|uniref:outer membrane protein n=1 Tax=Sinorhizobium sp. BG8 TaxID=2613773 RepID=UPI00193DACC4|nr:outer membrane protein [Sinorhizobium sp. BG8]QRM56580.1 porin family protein [Sinorhizobium sp. BG8]
MRKYLYGAVAALIGSTSAFAADVYQPEPVQPAPVEQVVVSSSGWYLRGDLGYGWTHMRGANYYQGGPGGFKTDFDDTDLDGGVILGGGVGYQWNDYLRTDVTVDYLFDSDFKGSTSGSCGVAANCVSTDRASMSALSLLANAYVDIGTYGGVTPYVGAGIGATRVNWGNLKNTSCDANDPSNCDPTITHKGRDSWRFTYALMAGASVDLTCNLKADAGYRFRSIDDGDMFGYAMNGGPGKDEGFYVHEARIGLRYSFNACEVPYVPPVEQPVYK